MLYDNTVSLTHLFFLLVYIIFNDVSHIDIGEYFILIQGLFSQRTCLIYHNPFNNGTFFIGVSVLGGDWVPHKLAGDGALHVVWRPLIIQIIITLELILLFFLSHYKFVNNYVNYFHNSGSANYCCCCCCSHKPRLELEHCQC